MGRGKEGGGIRSRGTIGEAERDREKKTENEGKKGRGMQEEQGLSKIR